MKKVFIAAIIMTLAISTKNASAQFEYAGGGIALATGGQYKYNGYSYYNKSFGFDLRAVYDYSKKLQIVPDIKIYLPNTDNSFANGESKTSSYVFNLNIHYIINPRTRENYRLYLLGGAHFGLWHIKDNHTDIYNNSLDVNEFKFIPGANAGAGMQFEINANFIFYAEAKYVVAKTNQLVFSPGFLIVL